YEITVNSVNGTVTKSPEQAKYDYGTKVELTATPAADYYKFTGWSGDASGTQNPLSVTMDGNKNITANFAINNYTLEITAVNGTVSRDPEKTRYQHTEAVVLTAKPNPGYTFVNWTGDATGNENPLTHTFVKNTNITAHFAIQLLAPNAKEPLGDVTQTAFTASWDFSPNATSYKLDVATDISFTNILPGFNNLDVGAVNNKKVTGLTAGTAYYYRVRAYHSDGIVSDNSNTVGVITLLLFAPTSLEITFSSEGIVLKWTYGTSMKRFYIYRDGGSGNPKMHSVMSYTLIDSVNGDVRQYIDRKALEGVSYQYSIVAVSENGATSELGVSGASTSPLVIPLKSPSQLAASIKSDGKVLLSWRNNSLSSEGSFIERSQTVNTNFQQIGKVSISDSTFIDDKVLKGIKYYYRLAAYKGLTKSDYSNEASVIGVISSVEAMNLDLPVEYSLFQNYPNPFNPTTIIRFAIPSAGQVTLKVFDLKGEEVANLVNEYKPEGYYEVSFNTSN
ncbi:MAG: InlB B-repeat-containing protein, partial [Melioribacteraceae bacterium]